jgi:hypothetical protein
MDTTAEKLDALRTFYRGIVARDPGLVGSAPKWITDQVGEWFVETLLGIMAEQGCDKVRQFRIEAIRIIQDSDSTGCSVITQSLKELEAKFCRNVGGT